MSVLDALSGVAEEDFARITSFREDDDLRLVIIMKDNRFDMAVVKCDTQVIYTQTSDTAQALIVLKALIVLRH